MISNDYTVKQGTSMASPFAAGAAALVIDALQQSGVPWSLSSSAQPLFVKMLMLAAATETNAGREEGFGNAPTLGRAATPKDSFEGFGLLNPDATVEALTTSLSATWTGNAEQHSAPRGSSGSDAPGGRKVSLVNGANLTLNLSVPSTADLDLYVYAGTATKNGGTTDPRLEQQRRARYGRVDLAHVVDHRNRVRLRQTDQRLRCFLTVPQRPAISAATVRSTRVKTVTQGRAAPPRAARPPAKPSAQARSAQMAMPARKPMPAWRALCVGSNPRTCAALDQCHTAGTCNASTGTCSNPSQVDSTACDDGNACTQTDQCHAGACPRVERGSVRRWRRMPSRRDLFACKPANARRHPPTTAPRAHSAHAPRASAWWQWPELRAPGQAGLRARRVAEPAPLMQVVERRAVARVRLGRAELQAH